MVFFLKNPYSDKSAPSGGHARGLKLPSVQKVYHMNISYLGNKANNSA
jgi:hypothetical protein